MVYATKYLGELGTKVVMVADSCPSCDSVQSTGKIHFDLDKRVFSSIDELNKGKVDISLRMVVKCLEM